MHLSPSVAKAAVHSIAVVLLLLIRSLVRLPLVVGVLCLSLFCALLCALSSFAIILKRKGELIALLFCLMDVLLL